MQKTDHGLIDPNRQGKAQNINTGAVSVDVYSLAWSYHYDIGSIGFHVVHGHDNEFVVCDLEEEFCVESSAYDLKKREARFSSITTSNLQKHKMLSWIELCLTLELERPGK